MPNSALNQASAGERAHALNLWLRIDIGLFRWLGAGHAARKAPLAVARVIAHWSWLPMLGLLLWVALPQEGGAWLALLCLLQAGMVQLAGKRLARVWRAQRPFALGLSPNHLGHGARAGFPSSHALVMGAVFGCLLPFAGDAALAGMGATALATAWARVYSGAHFPLDVIAGLGFGGFSGYTVAMALPWAPAVAALG